MKPETTTRTNWAKEMLEHPESKQSSIVWPCCRYTATYAWFMYGMKI